MLYNEDDDDGQNIDDGQIDDGQQQQQQQPVAIDHAAIAATVAQTMAQFQQPAQQRQMTPEEAAEHFQVWNPDEGYVNGLNKLTDAEVPLAERQALLAQMRDGMVNQAFRASEILFEQKMQQMDQRYAPALQLAQEREAKQLMGAFETKYPALKGQTELVNSITAGLTQQGFRPKSRDEAFDKVAEIAGTILKGANPDFVVTKSVGSGGKPTMAGTNMGGQGGGFQTQGGGNAPQKRGGLASFYRK